MYKPFSKRLERLTDHQGATQMEIQRVREFVPSGLRHLQQEPYVALVIGGDLSAKPYSFVVSEAPAVDIEMDTPQDEELFVMESTVIWSIGGIVQKSFTVSPQRAEKVLAAVWTNMDFEEEGHGAKVPRRTLVVLYTTFAKFYLDNGLSFVSNVPFVTSQVWALDRGILLSRQLEHGETADMSVPYLFTWTHPLEEIKWIPVSRPSKCFSPNQDSHGSNDKEKSATSFLSIEEPVLCVQKAHKSGKTIVLTLCNASDTLNVWEYEPLGPSGRKLERSYSAYRQSPLNGDSQLALDIARALGDTKSKIGLKWIASRFLDDR